MTDDGEKVLEWGRRILANCASLRQGLSVSARGLTGRLRIGVIPASLPVVPLITIPYSRAHPAVRIDLLSMTSGEIQDGLDKSDIDAAITYLDNDPLHGVVALPLRRERYVCVVPRDHRFRTRKTVSWLELAGERLCLLTPDMQHRRILDSIAAANDVIIDAEIVYNTFMGVWAHVKSGHWCSVIPASLIPLFGEDTCLSIFAIFRAPEPVFLIT